MSSPVDPAKTFAQDLPAEFVSIRGVVHLTTSFGVFLDVQSRRVFVGALCMQTPDRIPQHGGSPRHADTRSNPSAGRVCDASRLATLRETRGARRVVSARA